MKTIQTIPLQDFGEVDTHLVRKDLLSTTGVHAVILGPAQEITIEYDPETLTPARLFEVMCRCGVYPAPQGRPPDALPAGDG
jgi:hypothetical protein